METSERYYNMGIEYLHDQKPEKAILFLTKTIAKDHNFKKAYRSRGLAYLEIGEFDQAKEDFKRACKLGDAIACKKSKEFMKEIYYKGLGFYDNGRYRKALPFFIKAHQLAPEDTSMLHYLMNIYFALKEFEKALIYCNKYLDKFPVDDLLYHERGKIYYYMKNYEFSLVDLNKALSLNPNHSASYNLRGLTYHILGRYDDAIEDFTKEICLVNEIKFSNIRDERLINIYKNRADSYLNIGKKQEAKIDLKHASDLGDKKTHEALKKYEM